MTRALETLGLRSRTLLCFWLLCGGAPAVAAGQTAPAAGNSGVVLQPELNDNKNFPIYTVTPGDQLDVIYDLDYRVSAEDYVLDVQDEVEILSLYHTELNGRYRVRTDGKIALPYKGSILVAGLTVDQLIARLETDYTDIFKNPQIFVKLTEFGAKVEELKRIVSTDTRGQILEALVRPDGMISLPVIGDLFVSGLTLEEVTRLIEQAYRPLYRGLGISIMLGATPGSVFYVLGEVDRPGQYPNTTPVSVGQALAMAGVDVNTAGLKNVVVVSMKTANKPEAKVLNLNSLFKGEESNGPVDLILARNDIVFVPKSTIANVNLFVEQYIANLILFRGFSVVFGRVFNP